MGQGRRLAADCSCYDFFMPGQQQFDRRVQQLLTVLSRRLPEDATVYPRLTWRIYWRPMELIRKDRNRALKRAKTLLRSRLLTEQFFALTLLGQLCYYSDDGEDAEADKIAQLLSKFIKRESSVVLLEAAADALGDIYRVSAMPAIYDLTFHQNPNVRLSATQAYSSGLDVDCDNLELKYMRRIVELTEDKNPEVRSWATFHIGQQHPFSDIHSVEIRDVLIKRTYDRHRFTKTEAFQGLAERGDISQLPRFKKWFALRAKHPWHGDIIKNAETAGYFATPDLYEVLLEAQKLSIAVGADENEESVFKWALQRCNPDPIIRAKTPRSMGLNIEEFDWNLADDGVRVVYPNGDQIIDLQHDCELVEMYTNHLELVLVLQKTVADKAPYFEAGDKLAVVITGAHVAELPELHFPTAFNGIHALKKTSCTLSINDGDYRINGSDLSVQFIPTR